MAAWDGKDLMQKLDKVTQIQTKLFKLISIAFHIDYIEDQDNGQFHSKVIWSSMTNWGDG